MLHPELEAYALPFLEERLVADGAVATPAEARRLVTELKRYLLLCSLQRRRLALVSARIRRVWQEFALFTQPYADFLGRLFGAAPPSGLVFSTDSDRDAAARAEFRHCYQSSFGEWPACWCDAESLGEQSRLVARPGVRLDVRREGDQMLLVERGAPDTIVLRQGPDQLESLRFIAAHPHFYVRELAGADRLAWCRKLVATDTFAILD